MFFQSEIDLFEADFSNRLFLLFGGRKSRLNKPRLIYFLKNGQQMWLVNFIPTLTTIHPKTIQVPAST
jgi:hypothetical protein